MAADLPTRADVLRRAVDLLMPFPDYLPESHNARTTRGLALLQLHDRLPADPPAAVPVVEPVDPWAPVLLSNGKAATWEKHLEDSLRLSVPFSNGVTYSVATISKDGRWSAGPLPEHMQQRDRQQGKAPTQLEALPYCLADLRELGSLPPLPTKEG
jgi:hypothetical protein